MAEALTIEGNTYAPLTLAAQHLGYTREYILMHIADNKFDARKINNRWYVNLESAQSHFTHAKRATKARRDALSAQRKAEYEKHNTKHSHHHVALIETLAIMVIGLSLGVTGYLGTSTSTQVATVTESDASLIDTFSREIYTLVNGEANTAQVTPVPAEPVQTATIPTTPTTPDSLIVAPATTFTAEEATALQDSFSDPVTVTQDPNNPDTGIITPIFREGREGEEYRYLMVPVREE